MASQMAQRELEQSQKENPIAAKDNLAATPSTSVQSETKDPVNNDKPAIPPVSDDNQKESPIVAPAPSTSVEIKDPVNEEKPASPPTNDGI